MTKTPLIGRIEEQQILMDALQSPRAEMVSIIGRRRVGKTFLVNSVYKDQIDFEITGIQYATNQEQLENFRIQLSKAAPTQLPIKDMKNWIEAFHLLSQHLESKKKPGKLIVFLDELPWLASHRSGFLKGLSFFWNSWAIKQNIVLVICGSAASWMIKKVVHHKGGLHNRITKRISLKPFTLTETADFFKNKECNFDHYQILHLYMAMGGVPHYLEEVKGGKSAVQNINQICFSENGLLFDEFSKLYSSLFENADLHIQIVRALAKKRKGLTRLEIIEAGKLPNGGGTTRALEELIHSGFVSMYRPFGKVKKESLYRLTDEYSLFYLRFIEKNKSDSRNIWKELSQTAAYVAWSGYTFESICLKHIPQIKKVLGISGIFSTSSSYFKKGTAKEEGLQIDLLIDRNDHAINICEMKFYIDEVTITKPMAVGLRKKMALFRQYNKSKKLLFLTLVTTFGLKANHHSLGLIDNVVTLEDLFARP